MSLDTYVAKRKLDETPEPAGGDPTTGLPTFVVQLHRATRLHYDFRLEADGVLKSWAVPKGPSLDPKDKRLAMMVEDHPMDYRLFEGIIPKGNYGAGTVMVWDEGTYAAPGAANREEIEHEVKLGLHKGHAAVFLNGNKLKGLFDLIRLKGAEENAWLLVKRPDEFAVEDDVTKSDRSVLTGRTLEEIKTGASAAGQVWYSDRLPVTLDLEDAPKAPMPHEIKPMLANETDRPFDREGWLFEIKWDGYRAVAEVELAGDVRLYSRNQLSFAERYPVVIQALRQLAHAAVLDGEVVVVDDQGRSQFQWLQDWQKGQHGTMLYYVFDLLYLDGHDLRQLPLRRRKDLLRQIIPPDSRVRLSDHVETEGVAFYQAIEAQELEGMMAKKADSAYEEGRRSPHWLKVKRLHHQAAVIGGYTRPKNTRKYFGALVLGVYEGDDLVYVGHTGGGFTEKSLRELMHQLEPLARKTSPFKDVPKTNTPVTWVEPNLVCDVVFRAWTESGLMRQPVFGEMCSELDPHSVRRNTFVPPPSTRQAADTEARSALSAPDLESPTASHGSKRSSDRGSAKSSTAVSKPRQKATSAEAKPESDHVAAHSHDPEPKRGAEFSQGNDALPKRFPAKGRGEMIEIDGQTLKLTNLDKIFWPDEGYTKGNLIEYYRQIAQFILPYLKDRPESLNRHPSGVGQKGFFQKDMPKETPDWIETCEIDSGSQGKKIRYLLCQNEATLVYLANLACIEINPWHSRTGSLDRPDYVVIDLDPVEVDFRRVVETAQQVRQQLEEIDVLSYPKTSGSRGIHVYVPMGAQYGYGQGRQFAEVIARLVHTRFPEWTSLERSPDRRRGRVYLDFLQNRGAQTLAAAYSLRPRPGATVSTPLRWEEIDRKLDPKAFTIRTILDRLDKVGDLWAPVLGKGIDLVRVLSTIQESS